jgi:hypothetical protein
MADDVAFDDVDDWTLAKRKRVEASLLDDSVTGVTQYEQIAFKRWRSARNDKPQAIPITVRKSGGNAKREAAQAKIAEEKAKLADENAKVAQEVWKMWKENNLGSKEFRNTLACCAVDELQRQLNTVGEKRTATQVAQEIIDKGDYDGADPVLCARGLVGIMKKMREDPNYEPCCEGGRQTILNSDTSKAFWNFLVSELKIVSPTGQSSVTAPEEFIRGCWKKFYAKNDVTEPIISASTMAKALERFKSLSTAEPGQKKNQRGAEAMDDPRNFISYAALILALMAGRPDELKGNWDDVSFMVAEDMGVVKICYGHKEVTEAMKKLGRSMAWHHEEDGPTRQVRMFVVGFLSQGSGKLPLAVVKFYDRGLKQVEKIRTNYIGRAMNGCDMFWVWIKLPAAGA